MYIARDANGILVPIGQATADKQYFCPVCGGEVRIKDGSINAKHFAHISLGECDDFSHDMSEWHRSWQEKFPVENREVVVDNGEERHRADVLIGKYVIEFQHSSISVDEVWRRNDFYISAGYNVIWVFDVIDEYENEYIIEKDDGDSLYTWKYANKALSAIIPQNNNSVSVILQFTEGDGKHDPWLVMVDWAITDDWDTANYKRFIIDDFFSPDLFSENGLEYIMLNKRKRFQKLLRENRPYQPKCGRKVKGNPQSWYKCEKTGNWHNQGCESCPHNLIREYRHKTDYAKGGLYFYCCYPRVMHDIGHSLLPDHERVPTIVI